MEEEISILGTRSKTKKDYQKKNEKKSKTIG